MPMRRNLTIRFRRFLRDQRGATAIEYAIIAAGVAAVLVGTIATLGGKVGLLWETIKAAFS
jgi:pilus assembly protein Flp/PilA